MNRETILTETNAIDSTDTIFIEGLEFYGFHGVPDAEQAIGHRYSLDVFLSVDTRQAGLSDNVIDTVNYARVAEILLDLGINTQSHLLEHLAERMTCALLERFLKVQAVTLCVCKRLPPMNAIATSVGVKITRRRHFE